jgi:hypothetical protein
MQFWIEGYAKYCTSGKTGKVFAAGQRHAMYNWKI